MNPELILAAFLVVAAIGAVVGLLVHHNNVILRDLETERRRVEELHNKLMSRNYSEYAAFSDKPDPELQQRPTEYLMDPTGIIQVEADDDYEVAS